MSKMSESYHKIFFEDCESLQSHSSIEKNQTEGIFCRDCYSNKITRKNQNIKNIEDILDQSFFQKAAESQKSKLSCDLDSLSDLVDLSGTEIQYLEKIDINKNRLYSMKLKKSQSLRSADERKRSLEPIASQIQSKLPRLKSMYSALSKVPRSNRSNNEFQSNSNKCITGDLAKLKVVTKKYDSSQDCISRESIAKAYELTRRSLWRGGDPVMSDYVDELIKKAPENIDLEKLTNSNSPFAINSVIRSMQNSRLQTLYQLKKQGSEFEDSFKVGFVRSPNFADLIKDMQEESPGTDYAGLNCSLQGRYGRAREHVFWAGQAALTVGSFGVGAGVGVLSAGLRLGKITKNAARVLALASVDLTSAYYSDCVGQSPVTSSILTCEETNASVLQEIDNSNCALNLAITTIGLGAGELAGGFKLAKSKTNSLKGTGKNSYVTYMGKDSKLITIGDTHYVAPLVGDGEHRRLITKLSKEKYEELLKKSKAEALVDSTTNTTRRLKSLESVSDFEKLSSQRYSVLDPKSKPKKGDIVPVKSITQRDDFSMLIRPRNEMLIQKDFKKMDDGTQYYKMLSPIGERIYLRWDSGSDVMRVVQRSETPFPVERSLGTTASLDSLRKEARNRARRLNKKSLPKIASELTRNQTNSYGMLKQAREGIKLQKANEHMLELISQGKALTVEDLKEVNKLSQGPDGLYPGTVRGEYVRDIPLGETRGFNEVDVTGGTNFLYSPHQSVPNELGNLVETINDLGPDSTVTDIANIYQRFIVIHPFADGNGRTSRVLLDYMFQRTGVRPPRHSEFSNILYQTPAELGESLLERFNN
ncbi:MAG: Fic family protein [Bdellovibrionales bacterium]